LPYQAQNPIHHRLVVFGRQPMPLPLFFPGPLQDIPPLPQTLGHQQMTGLQAHEHFPEGLPFGRPQHLQLILRNYWFRQRENLFGRIAQALL